MLARFQENEPKRTQAVLTQLSDGTMLLYSHVSKSLPWRFYIKKREKDGRWQVGVRDFVKSGPSAKLHYTDLQSIFPPPPHFSSIPRCRFHYKDTCSFPQYGGLYVGLVPHKFT